MFKKHVANGEAVGIGCLTSIVAIALIFAPVIFSPFVLAVPVFIMTISPSAIIGALLGKYFAKNRLGAWLGAILGAIIGYFLFGLVASDMSFD